MRTLIISEFISESKQEIPKLKKHFDRSNKDLAKWIVDNLGVDGDTSTEQGCIDIIKSVDSQKYYKQLPPMYFFDSPAEYVPKGTWLIHFTKRKKELLQNGFKYGTPDWEGIGMSWGSISSKKEKGYNYAFEPDDIIEKYGSINSAAEHWHGEPIWFKLTDKAIKNYHFGDEIEQVIFWGEDASKLTDINPFNKI